MTDRPGFLRQIIVVESPICGPNKKSLTLKICLTNLNTYSPLPPQKKKIVGTEKKYCTSMAHQPKHILRGVHRNKVTYTKLLWESSVKKVRWVKKLIMIKRFTFSGYLLNCYVKFFFVRSTKKWANFSEISLNELFNLGTENSSQGWDGTNWWIDSFEAMEIKQDLKEKFVTKKNKGTQNHNDANNSVFIHFETTIWTGA